MQQLAAVALKLAVPDATFGRCGEKSCVFRCNHATTVAVYCQCYMQQLAAVARKIYSVIYNHGPLLREKLTVPDATTGRSNDKTCGYRCDHRPLWREKLRLNMRHSAAVARKVAVTGVTTGGSSVKICSVICNSDRCSEKSCVFTCNHATTVAYTVSSRCKNLAGSCVKICSVIYNHARCGEKGCVFRCNTPPL